MYDMREAMAYSGHLPPQQPGGQQQGITPELLDLLAMQKVDADKKAAAQQMALAGGQSLPTVADSMKQTAMQNARAEIAQKLGLPGLMQKMQAQQGPTTGAPAAPGAGPAMPPNGGGAPNGPPQGMARGGLTYLPSNLPKSYAGGGIIAFDDGGQADDPNVVDLSQFEYAPDDTINDKARKDAMRQQFIAAQAAAAQQRADAAHSKLGGGLSSAWGSIKDAMGIRPDNNNYGNEARGQGVAVAAQRPAPVAQSIPAAPMPNGPTGNSGAAPMPAGPSGNSGAAPMPSGDDVQNGRLEILNKELQDAMQRVQANPNDASSAQDVASLQREIAAIQKKPGAVAYYPGQSAPAAGLRALAGQPAPAAGLQAAAGQTPPPPDAGNGVPPDDLTQVRNSLKNSVTQTLDKTRGDVTGEQDALYNKYMAPGLAGIIANKQAALEELKALQAKQSAARPSDFIRALQLMGQNVHSRTPGIGGAFEGVSTGMDATHQGYAAQDISSMQSRQALLNDIAQAQQTNDIGRYQGAIAALKEHDASVNSAQRAGEGLLNNQNTVQGRLEAARERLANKPSGNEKAITDADAAYARDPRARNIQKQIDARLQPGYLAMNPNEPSIDVLNQQLDDIHNQYYVQHGVAIAPKATKTKPGFSIALNK